MNKRFEKNAKYHLVPYKDWADENPFTPVGEVHHTTIEDIHYVLVPVEQDQWISVEDSLPESDDKDSSIYVLVNDAYGIIVRPYDQYHKCWNTEDDDDYYTDAIGGKITHWMPLPSSPKDAEQTKEK